MRIQETTNYDKFELHKVNRNIRSTKGLEESMRRHGWIDAYPAHVVINGNGKYKIKAGHHRFTVAKKLGLPIKFVICDDNASIHELEKGTTPWNLADYLESYVRSGEPEYIFIKDYIDKTGLPLNSCLAMLHGQAAGSSGNVVNSFKAGTFAVKTTEHSDTVANIVGALKSEGAKWANTTLVVQTISKIVMADEIDNKRFLKKIKTCGSAANLKKQPNMQAYLEMFEEIYNYRNRDTRVPLAFVVNESARLRQKNFGKVND